tara:strand:- start:205 stop:861 length:657 start_codon:yes stop_codon:yes gene_type:complete
MKKVLLTIILSMFAFAQANAIGISIGAAGNQSVFYGSANEKNHDESGTLRTTNNADGAFDPAYASVFIEIGNETASIGASYSDNFKTPKAINEFNTAGTNNTTEVEAHFENLITIYGKVNLPLGGLYAKAGFQSVDIETIETTKSGVNYPDTETDGFILGFGYEHEAGAGFKVRLELVGHEFDSVKVDNGQGTSGNLNIIEVTEMYGATASLAVVKTF